jgi:hypothetical protein
MNVGNLAWVIPFLLFMAAEPALAGVGVDGAMFVAEGDSGDNIYHPMILYTGEKDSSKNLTIQVMGFGQTPRGAYYPIEPEDDVSPYSARPFLEVNYNELHLEAGGSQEVLLTGSIPEGVGDGGRYALVSIRSIPTPKEGLAIAVGVDAPVLITINGSELIHTGEIIDIEIKEVETEPGIDVSVIFNNTGNHHYKAVAKASLEDNTGKIIAEASTHSVGSILPLFSRIFYLSLTPSTELAAGTYSLKITILQEDDTILASEERPLEI